MKNCKKHQGRAMPRVGASGNSQLKPKRRNEEQEVAYIITDVKETAVTENFYQPIPVSILKYHIPRK